MGISERLANRTIKDLSLNVRNRKHLPLRTFDNSEIGNKYSYLTIIGGEFDENHRIWYATVECDCGNISRALVSYLKNGNRKTCGIFGCKYFSEVRQKNGRKAGWTGFGEIYGNRWAQWRLGAEKRGLSFEVSIEYAWNLFLKQDRKCALSGVDLYFGNSWNKLCSASLDRIDSSIGYTEDNIQWVHKDLNIMKGSCREDKFIEWCKLVYEYNKESEQGRDS